jgi:hypothetical protein
MQEWRYAITNRYLDMRRRQRERRDFEREGKKDIPRVDRDICQHEMERQRKDNSYCTEYVHVILSSGMYR